MVQWWLIRIGIAALLASTVYALWHYPAYLLTPLVTLLGAGVIILLERLHDRSELAKARKRNAAHDARNERALAMLHAAWNRPEVPRELVNPAPDAPPPGSSPSVTICRTDRSAAQQPVRESKP